MPVKNSHSNTKSAFAEDRAEKKGTLAAQVKAQAQRDICAVKMHLSLGKGVVLSAQAGKIVSCLQPGRTPADGESAPGPDLVGLILR